MTLQEMAAELGRARKIADGYACSCPCHDDQHASLSLTQKPGGLMLFYCHAHCLQDDLVAEFKRRGYLNGAGTSKRGPPRVQQADKAYEPATWVSPIPDDPEPKGPTRHPTLGKPHVHWIYRDKNGEASFAVCRFNKPDDDKEFRPLTFWRLDETGEFKWRWKAPPAPRQLFNLHEITARPNAVVLCCEGEKCATAGSIIFPGMVATTSMSGARGTGEADWSPLAGRDVIVWPDTNAAGMGYLADIAVILSKLPGTNVSKIDALALAQVDPRTGGTREAPAKFDAAFAIGKEDGEDGWEIDALRTAALGLVRPVDMAVVAQAKDSNIIDFATMRARVEAAGDKAAETLVSLIKDVSPKDRDAIAIAEIVSFAAKRSKIGTKVIKDRIARDANESGPPKGEGSPPPEDDDGRPIITIVANQIARIVDEIEAAVLLADLGLYQRGGLIVRIEDRKFLGFEEKEIIASAIAEQCEHTLLEDAETAVLFLKFNERKKAWIPADPTLMYIKAWVGRGARLCLPILSGPIGSPLILPTGRIIEKPGFDEATGFYFNPLGIDFPPVPRNPTRQDALDAVDLLDQLLVDFPFAEDGGVSRSVALAGLLTAVMRRAVGLAPMFAITAPAFGSGKSYLVNVFCALSTGRAASSEDGGSESPVPATEKHRVRRPFRYRFRQVVLQGRREEGRREPDTFRWRLR
jgi:hypothetical protein